MDALGHLHNAAYLVIFESTLIDMPPENWPWVVVQHTIDYLRPVRARRDPVRVETWLAEIQHSRVNCMQELFGYDDLLAARVSTWLVPCDPVSGKPRRITAGEKEHLADWTA